MDKVKPHTHTFRNFVIPQCFNYEIEKVEKSLKNLNDVLFVKMILSEQKDINEIHVITKDSSNPKKIIRDIESFLLAKYNIQVDYRKISIAQIKDEGIKEEQIKEEQIKEEQIKEEQIKEESESSLRLIFSDIKVAATGNHFEVIVQLESNGKIYEGKVSGINWDQNQGYLVAKATLEGISSYLESSIFFQIDEIKKIRLDSKDIVIVSINLINSKRKESLIGSAVIRDDFNKALVKAILKATNRRILLKEN